MSHDIFISYTEADRKIAEAVGRQIKIAFQGEILPRLAVHEIKAGDDWKQEIKKHLEECNAIISIITKNSINKPWIFIEWGFYWVEGKKFYILISDDVSIADLVHPMQDSQVVFMSKIDSIRGLFLRLSQDANCKDIPYEKAEDFVVAIQSAVVAQRIELLEKNYAKYTDESEQLPQEDSVLKEIFFYFYEKGDEKNSKRVIFAIKSDTVKEEIVSKLFRDSDYENIHFISRNIRSSQTQARIVIRYIDDGYDDSSYVRNLIDEISEKSSSHLKEICFHLAGQAREDSDLFRHIIKSMSSMAELRKVAVWFVDNERYHGDIFTEIIEVLSQNGAELRKIGILLAQNGKGRTFAFKQVFNLLQKNNQKKLLEAIEGCDIDPDLLC